MLFSYKMLIGILVISLEEKMQNSRELRDFIIFLVEEPGFKNVKNKHLGMSPF